MIFCVTICKYDNHVRYSSSVAVLVTKGPVANEAEHAAHSLFSSASEINIGKTLADNLAAY